jgi:hypothetical protein
MNLVLQGCCRCSLPPISRVDRSRVFGVRFSEHWAVQVLDAILAPKMNGLFSSGEGISDPLTSKHLWPPLHLYVRYKSRLAYVIAVMLSLIGACERIVWTWSPLNKSSCKDISTMLEMLSANDEKGDRLSV